MLYMLEKRVFTNRSIPWRNGNVFRTVNFSDFWMKRAHWAGPPSGDLGGWGWPLFLSKNTYLFISAALGLSCSMRRSFLSRGWRPPGHWERGVPAPGRRRSPWCGPLGFSASIAPALCSRQRSRPSAGGQPCLGKQALRRPRGPLRSVASLLRPAGRSPHRGLGDGAPWAPSRACALSDIAVWAILPKR